MTIQTTLVADQLSSSGNNTAIRGKDSPTKVVYDSGCTDTSALQDSNDARPLVPPSSESIPQKARISKKQVREFKAAFEEAIGQFHRGNEDGPYALRGEFSQTEFLQLDDRCELKWRLGYDKLTRRILLYGDPTLPHQATIHSLRSAVQHGAAMFFDQFGPTSDEHFNQFSPFVKAFSVLMFSGGQPRDLKTQIKQADELLQFPGVVRTRVALAIEVAFDNESSKVAAEETLNWVRGGQAEFALTVKIKRNAANKVDPFITVFFCDSREVHQYMRETSTGAVSATKPVIHEWPCGSGSAVAPKCGLMMEPSTLDSLNLQTAASPLNSNPVAVHYDSNFDAKIIFHGESGPVNTLRIPLGRSWAKEYRAPNGRSQFTAQDWDRLQGLVIDVDLGELRGEIVYHMKQWVEDGGWS